MVATNPFQESEINYPLYGGIDAFISIYWTNPNYWLHSDSCTGYALGQDVKC